MKRMTSKLTRVLVVTLLCVAAVTIANSQESPKFDLNALAARGEAIANEDPDPLVAELRNQQPEGLARRAFYIGMAAAEGQTLPGPGKDRIRDSLSGHEQRGFDTAVRFSVDRNRNADLAAKGAAIAKADPAVAEARNATRDVFYRLGFDIGMAAAEGQTEPGPGKDRIRDSLHPAEQGGFTIAVLFSLDRNRNAKLASTGAKIAQAKPDVAEARNFRGLTRSETNPLFRLGFDIATGIFGDPALGAQGNTATGPGSLKIRDSLSDYGQRGFDASVAFHSSRNHRP